MSFFSEKRGRQLIALLLTTGLLVLASALMTCAASAADYSAGAAGDQVRAGTTLTTTITATATITPTASPTKTPTPAPPANVIVNGGFEDGFLEGQGVGVGWGRFENGKVRAGWYDDTWTKVVYEGKHAQLLELKNAESGDRYVGIFQTVTVSPNAEYLLTLHGLVRSDEGSPAASNYGYRLQYGIDLKGGSDWQSSNVKWVELPWDDQPREDPTSLNVYRMETYTATVKAETSKLTLFIRGLKKWADGREGDYDIDGVSLVGSQPVSVQPTATSAPGMPQTGDEFAFLDNPVLVVASAVLLLVLAGGALWGVSRRRA